MFTTEEIDREISRRDFLQKSAIVSAAALVGSSLLGSGVAKADMKPVAQPSAANAGTPIDPDLPKLPYAYDALEPYIDKMTMEIHHGKHFAAYFANYKAALKNAPDLLKKNPEEVVRDINKVPEEIRTAVRNNGGGFVNHSWFWTTMAPKAGGEPSGDLAAALKSTFTDFATFKDQFSKAAMGRFGSGWAWLVADPSGVLKIISTANQDSPISDGLTPLMMVDVWEHAYYLKYQNRRADYLAAWWNVVNWPEVANRFAKVKK